MRKADGTLVMKRGEPIPELPEEERLRMLRNRPKQTPGVLERDAEAQVDEFLRSLEEL